VGRWACQEIIDGAQGFTYAESERWETSAILSGKWDAITVSLRAQMPMLIEMNGSVSLVKKAHEEGVNRHVRLDKPLQQARISRNEFLALVFLEFLFD
jgi:hypothetical protein